MPAGITATVSGNVVTLSGSASLASYQTAIRAITFASTGENPSTADRLINVVVNDGTSSSATAVTYVHVTAVNDAPVNTVPALDHRDRRLATVISGIASTMSTPAAARST